MSGFEIYGPPGGGGFGNVTGPASSTDNAVVRFDGTTGQLIQNSSAILSDLGVLSTSAVDIDVMFTARQRITSTPTGIAPTATIFGVNVAGPASVIIAAAVAGFDGWQFLIKDESLNASVNPITITVSGGGTIDGAASVVINGDGDSYSFYCDGSNYFLC